MCWMWWCVDGEALEWKDDNTNHPPPTLALGPAPLSPSLHILEKQGAHLMDGDDHGVPRARQLLKALERRLALEGVQARGGLVLFSMYFQGCWVRLIWSVSLILLPS